MLSISRLVQSFKDSWRGVSYVYKKEQNFRIQVWIALLVLITMVVFPLRKAEIILLTLLIIMVLTMELLNTAIENFSDMFKPRLHPYVGLVKDIMASAVLLTSLGALIIGIMILWPHFLTLLK